MTLAWGAKLSPECRALLVSIARDVGCDPSHLSACIEFESRWDPAAVNPVSGATGLIQFMPSTARDLGTTVEELARMPREQQLRYVLAYFRPYAQRMRGLSDVYMAILWPRAVGEPDEFTLFAEMDPKTRKAYLQNRGLDIDHDGDVSKAEATSFPARRLAEGLQAGNVWVEGAEPVPPGFNPVPDPSEDRTTTTTPPETSMGAIALPLLQTLLPSVLQLFSGRAQATIAEKTGADPQLAQQFLQGLIQQIGGAVGVPVKNDAAAIQAVAELHKKVEQQAAQSAAQSAQSAQQVSKQAAIIKELEAESLDYLHDLTAAMKDVVAVRAAEVQIEVESANAAASRSDAGEVRKRIDSKLWWAYGIGAAVLGAIAIAELIVTKTVDGQIVGALILAFGALGGGIITMINYGYGSSGSSGAKDVLIGEMARRQQSKDK